MRVMPWEGSGRYSPGPGMVKLLEKWFYQELRPLMAICSLNPPGNLAIVSKNGGFLAPGTCLRRQMSGGRLKLLSAGISRPLGTPLASRPEAWPAERSQTVIE